MPPALLDHRLDADAVLAEGAGDVREHRRAIESGEAEVGAAEQIAERDERSPLQRVRQERERRHAAGAAAPQLARDLDQVAHHGARGRQLAGPGAVVERRPDGVAGDGDRVHRAVDLGEQTRRRNQGRVDARFDRPVRVVVANAPRLGDREQLDPVAELARRIEVDRLDAADALGRDVLEGELGAERHRGEQGELVRGIDAVDVGARIRLGVAQLLRPTQHCVEGLARPLHLAQHVVRGSIDDAVHAADAVRGQALADRAQDRNAAAHARLEGDVDTALGRGVEDLAAVLGQQRLVRGDDGLAGLDRGEDQAPRRAGAADQLDHDVDARVAHEAVGVGVKSDSAQLDAAVAREVEVRDPHQAQRRAEPPLDHRGIAREHLGHARADRPEAEQPDADRGLRAHGAPASRR